MMTGAWNILSRARLLILLVGLLVMATGPAGAWEAPGNWAEIGTVPDWQEADSKFYRLQSDALYLDESHFNLNQIKEYEKTREYRGRLDGIGMIAWKTLDAEEQELRRSEARKELKYIVDFRNRILTQIQNTRRQQQSGWGVYVSDRTVVGTGLTKLRTAVALDPSDPYAWHLYSYFATLVGDEIRATEALIGAELALAEIPAEELASLRADIALDKGWLQRARGDFDGAYASLKIVSDNGGGSLGARVLRGLLAAQTGDDQTAITMAKEVRATKVGIFPPNLRTADFAPELSDVGSWKKRPSRYLHDWIMAYTWLREGRMDLATAAFGQHNNDSQRPLAHRFWNEAGMIYEVTGRHALALSAWQQARITAPYYPYLVYKDYGVRLGRLTGRAGVVPFVLGFDSNFLAGSRLAYGAALVEQLARATDDLEKNELATRALDQLESCQNFGLYKGQASVLQGQVYYLMNDLSSALIEIEEALEYMDARGDQAGFRAVLQGLAKADHDLAPQDIANFYGQSGTSRSRWQADEDPAATLKALRAAYADATNDKNRHNLARFLVRSGEVAEGRELAQLPLAGVAVEAGNVSQLSAMDLELMLEADRAQGQTDLAAMLVTILQGKGEDPWPSASMWTLAGFICLDRDMREECRTALQRAIELDPGNQGLKIQLALM